MGGYAWVTLATNDAYSLGALVLAHSLRRVGTKYELAVLVTPGVTAMMREKLAAVFSLVQEVNVLDSKDETNLALLARPELGITFTKLHCWRLTQYEKCVFVDADTLVVQNCDELFEYEELSAAPDVGWPDCFNSGVFVYVPSQQTFASITAFAAAKGSFDGGDQGLLNMYFSDWAHKDISKHLPFIYNMCSTATYSYLPAFKQFGENVRIIHFIGITKPWLQYFDTLSGTVQPPTGSGHLQPLLQLWWNIFCEQVHPQLSASMATSTLAPIWHEFALSPYIPPRPKISSYSDIHYDTYSDMYSQTPDFSEFKDPWDDYCAQNDPCLISSNELSDNTESYCNTNHLLSRISNNEHKNETEDVHQSNTALFGNSHQFHFEQQSNDRQSSCASLQRCNSQEYIVHNEDNRCQDQSIYYPKENDFVHHYRQQYSEQRHQDNEQQHNESRCNNEQHHYNEQRQHQHFHEQRDSHSFQYQSIQAPSCNGHQSHSTEIVHQDREQYCINDRNQTNYSKADNDTHIAVNGHIHSQHTTQTNGNQCAQNDFISYCYQYNGSNEQSLKTTNNKTETRRLDSSSSSPTPCTDLLSVATLPSDLNVTEHPNNANAGIAGALAQMTLGAPRSAEQIALEEHMRKQSWEQGQIDYMGRDSFDNIWKKICETLSLSPQRQPSPPKEEVLKPEESSAVTETIVQTVTPADLKTDKPDDKDPTPKESLVCKIPEEKLSIETTCGDDSNIITQSSKEQTTSLPSESAIETTTKVSTDSAQSVTEDACAKPITDSESIKLCETSTEASLPILPTESPLTTVTEQCKLASPVTQEPPSQCETAVPPETSGTQLSPQDTTELHASEVSSCPSADETCKLPVQEAETVALVTQTTLASTEKESQTPAVTTQDVTSSAAVSLSADNSQSQGVIASTISGETITEEATKDITESVTKLTEPLAIDPETKSEQHAVLLAASEISTMSPVPIQVAESVLEAEPKESALGAAAAVTDEALATTVTAVHESTNVPATTIAQGQSEHAVQMNGSTCEVEKPSEVAAAASATPDILPQETTVTTELAEPKVSDTVTMKNQPSSEAPSSVEEKIESSTIVTPAEIPSEEQKLTEPTEQTAKTDTVKTEQTQQVIKAETTEEKATEQKSENSETAAKAEATEEIAKSEKMDVIVKAETTEPVASLQTTETTVTTETIKEKPIETDKQAKPEVVEATGTSLKESPSEVSQSSVAEHPSVGDTEANVINIPLTPTVIEATPPTSPVECAQEMEDQEKTAKKSLKKSDSADGAEGADGADGDGADKKAAKKTVKKVTKKPKLKPDETASGDDGADSSQGKIKKGVKVAKKSTAKSGQTLEADTSVPETPPPSTCDAPIPPKRKTKATTVTKGTTSKRPEADE